MIKIFQPLSYLMPVMVVTSAALLDAEQAQGSQSGGEIRSSLLQSSSMRNKYLHFS